MSNSFATYIIAPLVGWAVAVSLAIVAYLAWLEFTERRRNRRLARKRRLLGLS